MNENEEGTQTQPEGNAVAQQNLSASEEVQPLSQPSSVSKADFEKLVGVVTDLSKQVKGRQSRADKFENTMTTKLNSLGIEVTPDLQEKLAVMDLQEKVNYLTDQLEGTVEATPQSQTSVDYAEIIRKANLNPSDPKIVELASQFSTDTIGFAIEVGKLGNAPPPPAAGVTIPAGTGNPSVDADLSELQEYIKNYTEALNSGNTNKANRIQSEARKKHANAWDKIEWEFD